MVPIGP